MLLLSSALRRSTHLSREALRSAAPATLTSSFQTARSISSSLDDRLKKSLITTKDGVHQTMKVSKSWRNKPLFRRQGDVRFKTGLEAAQLLVNEAKRRDHPLTDFIDSVTSIYMTLSPIFDRNPKYAFVAKTLMEPERLIQFRVAWMDDTGVVRMNRGYRIQFSSALGPYEGALHFGGSHMNNGVAKALAFEAVFSNALTGFDMGAAVGGSDFHPLDKSEAEMQRFCQSYMTELAKYIGPDMDRPWMGMGVGEEEMGYLYGQYKRLSMRGVAEGRLFLSPSFQEVRYHVGSSNATKFTLCYYILSHAQCIFTQAPGYGVVHFANEMLKDKNDSLEGKRCLILGSGKVARTVAQKLLDLGAIPISFSDVSGHVYEPDGIGIGQLRTIDKIKSERGALLGRYIISSTTAEFNNPPNIFDIPCDLCFPCGAMNEITEVEANKLADNGCMGVIEGGHSAVSSAGRKALKKRGLLYGPSNMTLTGSAIVHSIGTSATDDQLAGHVARIFQDVKSTASEFNARGDLFAGANIAGFLRVADNMMKHGAV